GTERRDWLPFGNRFSTAPRGPGILEAHPRSHSPMRTLLPCLVATAGLALSAAPAVAAESVDLTAAAIFAPPGISGPEAKAVQMLVEEVGRRSHVKWERVDPWPAGKPVIVVSPADGVQKLLAEHGVLVPEPAGRGAAEGYRIGVTGDAATP